MVRKGHSVATDVKATPTPAWYLLTVELRPHAIYAGTQMRYLLHTNHNSMNSVKEKIDNKDLNYCTALMNS
jgi:hypothetical protein